MTRVLLTLCPLLWAACLIPLPLEADNNVDGGFLLEITEATMPSFGTQVAPSEDTLFEYNIDVLTDSVSLQGRLYVQVDGNCCDLSVTERQPADRIHFLGEAFMVSPIDPGHFRVQFKGIIPCNHVPPVSPAYVIPVIATGGFIGDATGPLQAVGTLSKDRYWSVQCP